MRRKFLLAFLPLLLAATLLPLQGQQEFTIKKDIFVARDETQSNIISIDGDVTVDGRIRENIIAVGGTITLSGEVGDSVVGIGTNINLTPTAVVKGDVISLGGVLNKEPGCVIQGDTVYFKSTDFLSNFFTKGVFSVSLIPFMLILKAISFFVWLIVAIVVIAIFPRQITVASSSIRTSFWAVLGTGFLALILFAGLVIISALLSLVLIGIPFLILLIVTGVIIKIFGQVVLFLFFGESLAKAFGNKAPTPLLAVILGLILITLIKFIPIIGLLFSFCLSLIAWGAVIRTKFGSTENWFRKRA